MRKQIASFIVLLTMLCLCVSVPASAAAESKEVDEVAIKNHLTMQKLDIITDKISNYNSSVKRGGFVVNLMKISGFNPTEVADEGEKAPFNDVKQKDSFNNAITAACKLGYISVDSENFRPNEIITVGEAGVMLSGLLGYNEAAEKGGIKPEIMANRIGIYSGIDKDMSDKLTYGDMFKMLYTALFTQVLEPEAFRSDRTKYGQHQILLTAAFEIIYDTGIVEANPVTSIYLAEGCGWGNTEIDGNLYATSPELYDMIGRKVEYFYREADGKKEMVHINDYEADDVFTISSDDVEDFEENKLTFINESGKKKDKKIESSASFLYNGKLKKAADINKEKISGTITLIDNDDNNSADVVSIVDYKHIVVKGVDKATNTVYGTDGEEYVLEHKKNVRIAEIYSDGELTEFSDIELGNVLSVAASDSYNGSVTLIRAQLCDKVVVGSIMYSNDEVIKVNDETAEFEKDYVSPQLNGYGTFRFAFNGKIVDAQLENYVVYGYLYGIIKDGIDGACAKIFTDNGRWVELSLADRITYEGERKNIKEVMSAQGLYNENGFVPQLISYRVNADNKISVIDLAAPISKRWSAEDKKAIESGEFRLSLQKSTARFRTTLNAFDMQVTVGADTYIFVIPGKYGEKIDASKVYMAKYSNFVQDQAYENLYFYDIDSKGECAAMVIYTDAPLSKEFNTDPLYPVLGVGKGLSSEGNSCDVIMVAMDGAEVAMELAENVKLMVSNGAEDITDVSHIKAGDIVRILTDKDGKVSNITLNHRYGHPKFTGVLSDTDDRYIGYNTRTLISGIMEYVDEENKRIIVRYGQGATEGEYGDNRIIFDLSSVSNVYKYNVTKNTITKMTKEDVAMGQEVFMRLRYGKVLELIYYEK